VNFLKNILIGAGLTVLILGCQGGASEPNATSCGFYQIGTFKYEGSQDIRIERTKNKQIEYNLNGDGGYIYTDTYNIVWTNDCEYYLTLESTDHAGDLNFTKQDTMWTRITGVSRTGYTFTAVKGDEIFQGELKKVSS
jgi:hypothetical protein